MARAMTAEELVRAGAGLLGAKPVSWTVLAGGDLSDVVLAELTTGRMAVFKSGPDPEAEADMLRAIRAAGVPAPEVLGVSPRVLALELLPGSGHLARAGWQQFGHALRQLHAVTGAAYGWPCDYAFGSVAICNRAADTWPDFWAERRLLPECGRLPPGFARRLEQLAGRLPERLPATPAKSLLHGDLWSGNVLAADGRFTGLVDPACYHGHAEVDLAMLHLFGAPGDGFQPGYGAPEPGWEDRRAIYALWPAIVHVRLFGEGYHGLLDRLLDRAGV